MTTMGGRNGARAARRRFSRLAPSHGLATLTPAMEGASNYSRWIYETLAPEIRGHVLEVGSGFGVFSQTLAERHPLTATDYDPRSVAALERRFAERPAIRVRRLDITDRASVDALAREGLVDTVLSCNVLEHLEEDVAALENMGRLVGPGGRVIAFVPALEELYGSLDRIAGHHRRYDRTLLRARIEAAGLRPLAFRFFNLIGAIGWFVNARVVPQARLDADSMNNQVRIYDRFVVGISAALERRIAPPFGQSLVAIAERRA